MSRRSRTSFSSFSSSSPFSSFSSSSSSPFSTNIPYSSSRSTLTPAKPRLPTTVSNINVNNINSNINIDKYQRTYSRQHTETVPKWVHILPASAGLWNMIKTLRERGNNDLADKLETAAEEQAEAHLKTEQLLSHQRRSSRPTFRSFTSSAVRSPREATPPKRVPSLTINSIASGSSKAIDEFRSDPYRRLSEGDREYNKQEVTLINQEGEEAIGGSTVSVELDPATPVRLSPPPEPDKQKSNINNLNIPPLNKKNPNSCYHHRLTTYNDASFRWNSPSPSELAEAGFYFIGPKDCVQCFSCETCQKHWKTAEDPWVRHTRRSPSCDYIIETRGQDFIAQILSEVKQLAYSRTNSTGSNKGKDDRQAKGKEESEFTKMKNGLLNTQAKLRETKRPSSSGWRLDPYKERNVGANTARKKKI